jgi:hypothetical protein
VVAAKMPVPHRILVLVVVVALILPSQTSTSRQDNPSAIPWALRERAEPAAVLVALRRLVSGRPKNPAATARRARRVIRVLAVVVAALVALTGMAALVRMML